MNDATRRGFLTVAGAGAAAGVALVVAPGAASAAPAAAPAESESLPAGAPSTMAAYIHDLAKGEVTLMVDGDEVVVTDRALAARLARAFTRARRA